MGSGRLTKSQLVKLMKEGGNMCPELGTEVREGADNVKLNVPYEIINVESEVTTDVSFFHGVRVELLTEKAEPGSVMLWKRPVTGKGSKLGVFITVLGTNTDKWLHKWVVFKMWVEKKRDIEVVPAPKSKK